MRLGGGGSSRSYLVSSIGSNTETLPTTHNVPIVADRAAARPLKAASFVMQRVTSAPVDATPTLPDRSPESILLNSRPASPRKSKSSFRAIDRGRGDVLPTSALSNNRLRSYSSSNVTRYAGRRASAPPEQLNAMTRSLRNRRSAVQLDQEDSKIPIIEDVESLPNGRSPLKQTWSDTFGKMDKPRRISDDLGIYLMNMRRIHLVQLLFVMVVFYFVWDSYAKAMSANTQMMLIKQDESMMMLHLRRLEEQSLNLHEAITRLSERGPIRAEAPAAGMNVDNDLIKVQYEQLKQMEDELSVEVKSLQAKIRQADRANIVRYYGEGPVQVILDIDFADQRHVTAAQISILLWYETPHASWTLLDQIRRGLWDGAAFTLESNAVVAEPTTADQAEKRLDFVEKGQKRHESWTVGLTESSNGVLSLFINLKDNTQLHKHDVCIGKIIDGFDTLQRLTRSARAQKPGQQAVVSIKKASASHLTRRESAGLI